MAECPICYEPVSRATASVMPCCGKAMCVGCAEAWHGKAARRNRACAWCRRPDEGRRIQDASKMKWACYRCGGGNKASDAVVCEGRKCLLNPDFDVYVEDAGALCYPCAGVTSATVSSAPAFVCQRCCT